jgi:hypothetical protein
MIDTGDGLTAMALAAGKIGHGCMYVLGFLNMTIFTAPTIIELNTQMRVCQTGSNAHLSGSGAVRKKSPLNTGYFHKGALTAGKNLILFIIARAGLISFVAMHSRGHLFLSRNRPRQYYKSGQQQNEKAKKDFTDAVFIPHSKLLRV